MKRWLLVLLPVAIVFVAVICIYFYLRERDPVLLAERWISATQKVRVLEYAPDGRFSSDYLIYRFEYYHRGHMWSCASFTSDSYNAQNASIEIKGEHVVVVRLDGNPIYQINSQHDAPFGSYWTEVANEKR